VSRGLLSPRASGPALADLGERSALLERQRVGRVRRSRPGRRRARRRVLAALAAGLATLALGGAGVHWLLTSPRFAVGVVEVRGASRVPVERILAAAGIRPGTSLWRIDPAEVIGRLQALPGIRRADLVRELPNHVTLMVEERRPFTLVAGTRLHWLDEEGLLLGEAGQAVAPPVPVISGLTDEELAAMRTHPGPRARAAVALIRSLLRTGSPLAGAISEIDMSRREGPVLYTVDGIEVRLGSEDWEERLARLEGVLAQVAGRDEGVRTIDLRFRDQVVLQKGGQG
jgi:cell division septal protein FtsQ